MHNLAQYQSTIKRVFYLIGSFFIVLFMYAALPVMAQTSFIKPSFDKTEVKTKKNSTLEVNLFLTAPTTDKISGASVFIEYPAKILEYSENLSAQPNTECKKHNYKLTQVLATKNDPKSGIVRITKVQIAGDDALPSGKFCFGTLTFKTKPSFWFLIPWFSRSGTIAISNPERWEIVGPKHSYKLPQSVTQTILKVTETN